MMITLSIPLQRYQPELERNVPLFIPVPAVSWLRWCSLTWTAIWTHAGVTPPSRSPQVL